MSKKKGLSVNEKKTKLLEIFHETHDVFQLKDIERIAPKSKGITQQSVKTILQDLVDDGSVETGKIGNGVYFWSFPSKVEQQLKNKISNAEIKLHKTNLKLIALKDELESKKSTETHLQLILEMQKEINCLKTRLAALDIEINQKINLDPEAAVKKCKEIKDIFSATNRWTDNIFNIKSWCKKKYGMEDSALDKNFEIPEDFDYVPEDEINKF